ncbi:MAG: zf-HC2 domain-containing protein [Phycisphaerae bacterium]
MTCGQVQRDLPAFADGELPAEVESALRAHVDGCGACSQAVAEHRALRRAIHRVLSAEPVPVALAARVRVAYEPSSTPQAPGVGSVRRWAIAAALLLAAGLSWYSWRDPDPLFVPQPGNAGTLALTKAVAVQAVTLHRSCVERCRHGTHQRADLPGDIARLVQAAPRRYANRLDAAVLNFRQSGFRLDSSDECGFEAHDPGLHVVYVRSDDQLRLSLLNIPRTALAADVRTTIPLRRAPYYATNLEQDGNRYAVVGWQGPRSSYLACAALPSDLLLRIIEAARPTAGAVLLQDGSQTDMGESLRLYRRNPSQKNRAATIESDDAVDPK